VSRVHLLPVVRVARAAGARIVLVYPVHHRTGDLSDLVLQPRPGGDLALAPGAARRLFERKAVHAEAASWCDHLDAFRQECFARSLEEWAALADVPVEDLRALADLYAAGPSAILVGWGLQRRARGAATVRALDALAAVTGNLGIPGGGVSSSWSSSGLNMCCIWTSPRRPCCRASWPSGWRWVPCSPPRWSACAPRRG
jgi:anaerobic selenocysteine-containing dehydrogenase